MSRWRVVVLHGIESTGKSTLAADLAAALNGVVVPEYGRAYCEAHGTDCSAQDLQTIAATQQALIAAAASGEGAGGGEDRGEGGRRLVIADTDWLMTRAWHRMMLGSEMDGPAYPLADLYLHLAPDVPWVDDGLRLHAELAERRRFDALCRAELARPGLRVHEIAGDWAARRASALAAVAALAMAD